MREKLTYWLPAMLGAGLVVIVHRWCIPAPSGLVTIDDFAAALLMVGILAGAMAVPRRWQRAVLLALALGSWLLFVFGNSIFFEFFRGYMDVGTLTMVRTAPVAMRSLGASSWWPFWVALPLFVGAWFWLVRARHRPGWRVALVAVLVALSIVFGSSWHHRRHPEKALGATNLNPMMGLGRSIVGRVIPESWGAPRSRPITEIVAELLPTGPGESRPDPQYPFYKVMNPQGPAPEQLPNILLVVLESLRAAEMGVYGAKHSVTPFLDGLARQALVAAQHYATSAQTIRAEVGLHCSIPDHMGGSPWAMMGARLQTNCLPSILKEHGYETHWFHGFTGSFFARKEFLPTLGIDHIHAQEELAKEGLNQKVGLGIPDRHVLIHAIEKLEQLNHPFYAEIMTLSNHHPFDAEWDLPIPDELDGDSLWAAYRRGMYYTDASLAIFWERFQESPLRENTIVVFVGDHGIWVYDPDADLDDLQRSEQVHRVPFLAIGPGIKPGVIEGPTSHYDFAPSVLSWTGITAASAFLGRAMQSQGHDVVIPMVGQTLVNVRYGNTRCFETRIRCPPSCGKEGQRWEKEALRCVILHGDPLLSRKEIEYTDWSPKDAMVLLQGLGLHRPLRLVPGTLIRETKLDKVSATAPEEPAKDNHVE